MNGVSVRARREKQEEEMRKRESELFFSFPPPHLLLHETDLILLEPIVTHSLWKCVRTTL